MKVKITEEMKTACQNLMYDMIYDKNPEAYEDNKISDSLYDKIYEIFGSIDDIEF